ncbi:MAG: rhomboid family intramembrane serine protease [Bdellovibrionota bacterium]
MIFPGDFKEFSRKPELKLSWVVFFLNIFIFIVISIGFDTWPSPSIRKMLNDQKFVNSVYEMYVQTLDPIEKKKLNGSVYSVYARALKDQKFWGRALEHPFKGDKVQIRENRKAIAGFYDSYLKSANYYFGLGALEVSPWSWITYQFVHVSFIHLLANILLIFLIISYLEKSVNSLWIAATYFLSGFAGGISFLFFDNMGGISMVGASASASGLLSFLLIIQSSRLMPWGFVMAPVKEAYGQIYLPVFFIFPIFLVWDFISLLSEPSGVVSNVAVSAHVGGIIMGFIIGAYYSLFLRSKSAAHSVFSDHDGLHELP